MKEEYSYDKHGRINIITEANGAATYYSYFPFGTKVIILWKNDATS